jgi:hypothetical protein
MLYIYHFASRVEYEPYRGEDGASLEPLMDAAEMVGADYANCDLGEYYNEWEGERDLLIEEVQLMTRLVRHDDLQQWRLIAILARAITDSLALDLPYIVIDNC